MIIWKFKKIINTIRSIIKAGAGRQEKESQESVKMWHTRGRAEPVGFYLS